MIGTFFFSLLFVLSKVRAFYVKFDPLFSDKHCIVEAFQDENPGRDCYRADTSAPDQLIHTDTDSEKWVQSN